MKFSSRLEQISPSRTLQVMLDLADLRSKGVDIIDLGPEGGDKGGNIVVTGTPEEVAACRKSYTGKYLKPILKG